MGIGSKNRQTNPHTCMCWLSGVEVKMHSINLHLELMVGDRHWDYLKQLYYLPIAVTVH